MKTVCVHLATGFEEIEAVSIIDILRRAGIPVKTISVTGNKEVIGSHEIPVIADKLFEEIDYSEVEMIILPGGMPGSKNLNAHEGLKQQIMNFHREGKPLGAICAAPMVFGELGILNNLDVTCFPGFENHLHGAIITEELLALSGNIITGKGAGVAIHFALKIVEMLKGKKLADSLKEKMIVP
ncbi:MAG: DJ-1/PfpI family protein [Prolixibacteraceae bacterium]|nr:DJ-1/PfpI family protein [Prolixibacteraceae bacterium]